MVQNAGPSPLVCVEWRRRVEAEYRSAAVTSQLVHWLIQIGASPSLIDAGMRIVKDEIRHAELSNQVLEKAWKLRGDIPVPVQLQRESLELTRRPTEPLEGDVLRVCIEIFCLGETVAVPLFAEMRKKCTVPVARKALDRVLVDEVRHRDFGWLLLAWFLEHPDAETWRPLAQAELPQAFSRLKRSYYDGVESFTKVDANDRAWGLIEGALYKKAVEKALKKDWIPRFARWGLSAEEAFGETRLNTAG